MFHLCSELNVEQLSSIFCYSIPYSHGIFAEVHLQTPNQRITFFKAYNPPLTPPLALAFTQGNLIDINPANTFFLSLLLRKHQNMAPVVKTEKYVTEKISASNALVSINRKTKWTVNKPK